MRYDATGKSLTCAQKLTDSQLNVPRGRLVGRTAMVTVTIGCRCNCCRNTLYKGAFRTDGSGPVVISGLSWIGGACNGKFRTSVNKEFGQYGSINTGAHELGHKYAIDDTSCKELIN